MRTRIYARLWIPLLTLIVICMPTVAAALTAMPTVTINAKIEPDGTIWVTDRRVIRDPRKVEFLEFLVPQSVNFEIKVADQKGDYAPATGDLQSRTMRMERSEKVTYVEWQDDAASGIQEVVLTYRIGGALIQHKDGMEWYWPAVTGSGERAVDRVDAVIELPAAGPAYLYAYGGAAGGTRVLEGALKVSATDMAVNKTLEWRLLIPRSTLPQAGGGGEVTTSDLASIRLREDQRMADTMGRAERDWLASLALVAAPLALGALYWFTVRRPNPNPDPSSLSAGDLTMAPPAVVGWVYEASWLDYASAQLMYLERQGQIKWDVDRDLRLRRVPGVQLSDADEALLNLMHITDEPITPREIATQWSRHGIHTETWFKEVGKQVPPEWLNRPSPIHGIILAGIYVVAGVVAASYAYMAVLWAVAALAGVMVKKRRWLSPLGESHMARWITVYRAAYHGHHVGEAIPDVPPEYFLAVEIGDEPLASLMGAERYRVVKMLYEDLDD